MVEEILKSAKEPTKKQLKWLKRKRSSLENKAVPKEEQKILDDMTPYLGYSWRDIEISSSDTIFKKHYNSIIHAIDTDEKISHDAQRWLSSQGHRFAAQKHLSIPKGELKKLRELKKRLKLQWKISEKTSFIENMEDTQEDPIKRENTERFLFKIAPMIRLTELERRYGIPKGTLQKAHRYQRKLDYKWILAVDDFKKEFLKNIV